MERIETYTIDELSTTGTFFCQPFPAELVKLMKYGDEHSLNLYESYRHKKTALVLPESQTAMYYNVSGDFVDIGRYVTSEPECMIDYIHEPAHKFLDVTINAAMESSFSTNKNYVAHWFSLIIDTIDLLERSGYRCRVFYQYNALFFKTNKETAYKKGDVIGYKFLIKNEYENLNIRQFCGLFMTNKVERYPTRHERSSYDSYAGYATAHDWRLSRLNQTTQAILIPSIFFGEMFYASKIQTLQSVRDFMKHCQIEFLLEQ